MQVLIVDGDGTRRTRLFQTVEGQGHAVRAADPAALAASLRSSPADVVLLQGASTFQDVAGAIAAIITDAGSASMAVIVVSSGVNPKDIGMWMAAGADDWVDEPIVPAALDARMRVAVERRRAGEAGRLRLSWAEKLADQMETVILPIGLALSAEANFDRLMERILIEAKALCRADAGTLYLRSEDDALRFMIVLTDSLGVALGGTSGNAVTFPLLRLYDPVTGAPNHRNVATYVALTGQSINIPDIYQAEGFDFSGTKEFDARNAYRSVSSLTVPLKDHTGHVTGVLQLLNARDSHGAIAPFGDYDQHIVEALSSLASVALNNNLLLQRQQALSRIENDIVVARRIHDGFLPSALPAHPGWEIDARFRPARQVGGDFYDSFALMKGRTLALVIADVCDKGVGAALFMALTRSLLRAFAMHDDVMRREPALGESSAPHLRNRLHLAAAVEVLGVAVGTTNAYILAHHADLQMFITVFFGMLDLASGDLLYINAGHCSPMIVGSAGVKRRLATTGPAVGIFGDAEFGIQEDRLDPGDTLLTFTDGVTDARNPAGAFFGEKGLASVVAQPTPTVGGLLDAVESAVRNHAGGAVPYDDVTLLAVRRVELNPAVPTG